jgi:hypothetical protein
MSCQTASWQASSYNDLIELFERLGNFLKRLEIYTKIPPSLLMTDLIFKIVVELLSVLALATKKYKEGRFSKCAVIHTLPVGSMCHRAVREEIVGGERDRGRSPEIG